MHKNHPAEFPCPFHTVTFVIPPGRSVHTMVLHLLTEQVQVDYLRAHHEHTMDTP